MTLDDLLMLLQSEFALDVDSTQAALDAAAQDPSQATVAIEPMLGFIDRSIQVSALVGLQGWGAYLQQIAEIAAWQLSSPDRAVLQWLRGWISPAQAYLEAPAQEQTVNLILDYLRQSPMPPEPTAMELLASLLAVPPQLAEGEAAAELEPVADASPDDLSLATDDVDQSLLSAMLQDAPDQLEQLAAHLDRLAHARASVAQLTEAQRISHTLKGSGNIIGLPGIGRLAHRLEDVLEWSLERVQQGEAVNPAAVRDMQQAVQDLQQMVAHLQGEEALPDHALATLQRLIDWLNWIRDGSVMEQSPDALNFSAATNSVAINEDPMRAEAGFSPKNSQDTGPSSDTQTLRVGVDRLSRVLRRAGQSIVSAQRMSQTLRDAQSRLEAFELAHVQLTQRLRELEQTVDKQVVQLREQRQAGSDGFDPLEMDRYDALHGLSRFVAEAVQDELELARDAKRRLGAALKTLHDDDYALREQHRELLAARLVPVKSILPRLKRNVTQTASTTGKQARLVVQGESTSLDADVLTRLTEPLLHLLRNAVDHGIETPEERVMLGKDATGTITLSFRRVGQEVELVCADDGRGLDLPTIYDKALEYGLIAPGMDLPEDELRRLILKPGFSTKGEVTEVSGRGVGMDVVNDRVTALKGRLDIQSEPFAGSQFIVHVPVSTGASQALIVDCAGESVALSSDQVQLALAADECVIVDEAGVPHLLHNDRHIPIYRLGVWLGFEDASPITVQDSRRKPCVIAQGATGLVAVIVDAVVDARELILQDVGRLARRIAGVVGGALRGDGRPMFLLDVPALERAARTTRRVASSLALRKRMAVQKTRVLVVDDALSVRRSMQQLLEDAGYEVQTANDGFEAMDSLRAKPPAIVLTDLEMPNLNGLELTRRIREVPQHMGLPVVMITSRASDKHRLLAEDAGIDLYLTKPYTDAVLLEHIRRLTAQDPSALLAA
jgi:chemotaxis protein histidine kinase CheA/ActR/RegA family two-component response regulator